MLVLLLLVAPAVTALGLEVAALGVLVAVAASDRLLPPPVSVRDQFDAF